MDTKLRTSILLSIQRALVGEIVPCMRAIAADWSPKSIEIRVYTDGEAPDAIKDDFDAGAITQIVADFPYPEHGDPVVTHRFETFREPLPLPEWGTLVFARAGVQFQRGTPGAG